tara:strand:+ start:286 stop:540 length:255 start_codon:yes stop_codon:yes gene_type:complete
MDESSIYKRLYKYFDPSFLEVDNESHLHKHHSQSPNSGNSHFSIKIKSKSFEGLNRLQGQRKIYDLFKEELKGSIHALNIKILD